MIARLLVQLPFEVYVREGEQFPLYEYDVAPYKIRTYLPLRSTKPSQEDQTDYIAINDVPAFGADVLRIDFIKYSFDRCVVSMDDPSTNMMESAVNSFLIKLRHVGRAPHVRPVRLSNTSWRLQYLNDDESELPAQEGFHRGRGGIRWSLTFIALTKPIWEDVFQLPADYRPTPWDELLLDAFGELPNIGAGIVLAATALEIFIARTLDQLAARSKLSPDIWKWLNVRKDRDRNPSVEEQFDSLLKILASHSLKEEPRLWELFTNLKTARNSFVHEGVAKVGGSPIDDSKAKQLILAAGDVIKKIQEWLPEDLRSPSFAHTIKLEVLKKIPHGS